MVAGQAADKALDKQRGKFMSDAFFVVFGHHLPHVHLVLPDSTAVFSSIPTQPSSAQRLPSAIMSMDLDAPISIAPLSGAETRAT